MNAPIRCVEVFKTNVDSTKAPQILTCLSSLYEGARVSFDLEDIDRVLRIASSSAVDAQVVICVVESFGFHAEVLPDEVNVRVS